MSAFTSSSLSLYISLLVLVWPSLFWSDCCTSAAEDDNVVFLNKENFVSMTGNKTVFVKWAAPWCGHSQDLAPAWKKLAETDFDDALSASSSSLSSSRLLIAEVDCTKETEWCQEMGYTAYPTLTYGDANRNGMFLQRYQSSQKDYQALRDFVQTTLMGQTFCSPGNYLDMTNGCTDQERANFQRYFDIPFSELQASIAVEEGRLRKADADFQHAKETMQFEYDQSSKEHQAAKAKNKRQLKLMQRILQQQQL